MLTRFLPFLSWFKGYSGADLRLDLLSGLTVALVLIPQSMAYAQLAGLPAYYGLYAAFLPPMVAALFGSSRQLATGPVAVVSLMTAATLEPLATAGSPGYIAYAVFLALIVGVFQLALGLLRLGVVVNFLSHPVVNGFTNAAAIIIATSQLSKIFGVHVDKAEHHYLTVWRVLVAAAHYTHWSTVGMAVIALVTMIGLKRLNPKIPNVLVAVAITTVLSWATGFEHTTVVPLEAIACQDVQDNMRRLNETLAAIEETSAERAELTLAADDVRREHGKHSLEYVSARQEIDLINLRLSELREMAHEIRHALRFQVLTGVVGPDGELTFVARDAVPAGASSDGRSWRLQCGNSIVDFGSIKLSGGGDVVGTIPEGLPRLALPEIDLSVLGKFLGAAVIISLLGFMEAISIAKAMAAKSGQRLDPNQELIGQGLGNIIGAIGQSYPVSGSFSRSAVNFQAGAVSGLSSVVTSLVVVIVLLFFTPLLYHLPQSVLASVIMMAVIGLVNVSGFLHAWKAQRTDGIITAITFAATLVFAPHLDRGILIGVVLSIGAFLHRGMRPRIMPLSLYTDGTYRDAERWGLEVCKHVLVLRFNGTLFFANASHLESQVLSAVAGMPELEHVVLVGNGMNEIDASGEEVLSQLYDRLHDLGLELSFTGLNDGIVDTLRRTRLLDKIGEDHLYSNVRTALNAIFYLGHEHDDESPCPLIKPVLRERREEGANAGGDTAGRAEEESR